MWIFWCYINTFSCFNGATYDFLSGKSITGRGVMRADRGYYNNMNEFLIPLHPLSNIEITKYFIYKTRFKGVFSRDNLPKTKGGAYVINLNDKNVMEHIGFHYLLTKT